MGRAVNLSQLLQFIFIGTTGGPGVLALVLAFFTAIIFAELTRCKPSRRFFYAATFLIGVLPLLSTFFIALVTYQSPRGPSAFNGVFVLLLFLTFVANPAAIGWWIDWGVTSGARKLFNIM